MAKKDESKKKKNELEPLKIKGFVKATQKGELPTIMVEGNYPTRYNEASAVKKDAEELMAELKPVMLPEAMNELFRHNGERPWDPIASVKLKDDSGEVTRVTFTSKYSATVPAVAEALFGGIRTKEGRVPDINDYLIRTMVGTFDSTVFLGADGRFDEQRYQAIAGALATICKALGLPNPLSVVETVQPLPDFHNRRWMDFDLATNLKIAEVIPNQVNFVPCPKAAKGKDADKE